MILALQVAAAKAGVRASEIGRIAISSQAPTMLPVDAAGRPLCNALIWMDRRSDAQCIDMGRTIGSEDVYRITGNKADPFYVYSELLWFKQNQPALYEKTRWILQANGYLNLRLTGSFTLDATHASITQCYDVLQHCWSSELLRPYGVPAELFPPVSQPVEVIGTVTQEAAAQTGLRAGTEVLAGSVDGAAAALEGGVTADGVAVEMSGTSSVLLVGSDRPHTSPNLTYMYSVVPEQHLLLGCMSTTGGVLKWYRDTFCDRTDPESYKKLDAQIIAQCPEPSPLIFLPYLAGERAPIWDTNAEGYEMNAIAAVVIGGTSMSGGEGSLIGTVIGTMLIGVIANGMNLLLIPTGPQRMVTGSIIVIAVIVDVLRKKANSKSK